MNTPTELRNLTTFKLGGPCLRFTSCDTPEALISTLSQPDSLPRLILGEGSNILCSDRGFSGHVIRFIDSSSKPVREQNKLLVSGGMLLDELCSWTCERGLGGLQFCSGIPGTVGGALAGNAGAFGHSLAEHLISATLLSPDGRQRLATPRELNFKYRRSRLKETGEIVVHAQFALKPEDSRALLRERSELLAYRSERHPDYRTTPCAGSFFRNVQPSSKAERRQAAGWFLDQIGARKQSRGGAAVFPGHANIIINRGPNTQTSDVIHLAASLKRSVFRRFGLHLRPEVQLIGFTRLRK